MDQADTVQRMAEAATHFLSALGAAERQKAEIDFADTVERENWHYIPRDRAGLPLKEMDQKQRELAHALVATGVSARGYEQVSTIISLEPVLAELEGEGRRFVRDPELYYLSVWRARRGYRQGERLELSRQQPWRWRASGSKKASRSWKPPTCSAVAATSSSRRHSTSSRNSPPASPVHLARRGTRNSAGRSTATSRAVPSPLWTRTSARRTTNRDPKSGRRRIAASRTKKFGLS